MDSSDTQEKNQVLEDDSQKAWEQWWLRWPSSIACNELKQAFEAGWEARGKQTKLVSMTHDGDCSDCSTVLLEVPSNVDIEQAREAYITWYHDEYTTGRAKQYLSFDEWLIQRQGAKHPEMEEYSSHP